LWWQCGWFCTLWRYRIRGNCTLWRYRIRGNRSWRKRRFGLRRCRGWRCRGWLLGYNSIATDLDLFLGKVGHCGTEYQLILGIQHQFNGAALPVTVE
jgi:hypothetical protein